jgi:hypothetical protein
MESVHVTGRRLWKAVAFAAALWIGQSSPAAGDDRIFADLNGDGRTDQVAIVGAPGRQTIRLTFSSGVVKWLGTPRRLRQVVAGDLNRDGKIDLVASTENLEIVAWLNRGHGRFTRPKIPRRSHRPLPGPIVSSARSPTADAYSIGSDPDPDSAIVRLPFVIAALVPRASLTYSDPIVVEWSTTPSRPRGPPTI